MFDIIKDYIKNFSTLIAISILIIMLLFGAIGYCIGLYICDKQLESIKPNDDIRSTQELLNVMREYHE